MSSYNRRNSICVNSVRNSNQIFDGSCIVKNCIIDGFYSCYYCNNLTCIKHTTIFENNIRICFHCLNNDDLNNSIKLLITNKNKKKFCDYFICFKKNNISIKPI